MKTSTIAHGSRIALYGRLDARAATVARAALHAAVLDGAGDLVVDMSGVDALDAVGLGVLVANRRLAYRHGRTLVLSSCTPRVAHLLRATRLHRILTVSQEAPAACYAAGPAPEQADSPIGGGDARDGRSAVAQKVTG